MPETLEYPPIPPDDLSRTLAVSRPGSSEYIGLVGNTYTITVSGSDTGGRFCVIDMHVPPGGGPPPHRHDFDETFIVLEGEIETTFRGERSVLRAGETANIPSNAPHQFRNASSQPARILCICSPAGLDDYFREVGTPVATRTSPPPPLKEEDRAAFVQKSSALSPKYRTELL
jgi:quercetin dioxygenase-like cupin family protein